MIRTIALIAGLMCGFATLANAEIYQWVDSYGAINFTDNKDKVPPKYPIQTFVFTKEHQWTVDQSNTGISNQSRLDALRKFNTPVPKVEAPKTTVIIENHWNRNSYHRYAR